MAWATAIAPRYRVLLPEVATLLAMADLETWSAQQRRALELYAPLLCMISDLGAWAHKEKGALLRITKSKGERSESQADLLLMQHERSCEALRRLAS